jgi:hypothetical protein
VLQRNRKRPRRFEEGTSDGFFADSPQLFYKRIYFECLDVAVVALKDRFQQHDYSLYANMEQLLTKAFSKLDYSLELQQVTDFFP